MGEFGPKSDIPGPYNYQPLESPLHIRLIHLLPGQPGEDLRIQIQHELLRQPEQVASGRLSLRELRRTLPPNWDVFETLDGRYIFMYMPDDASIARGQGTTNIHTWVHPVSNTDPGLYELPPPACADPAFEALSYVWGAQDDLVVATVENIAGKPVGSIVLGESLASALNHLRYQDRTRVLWADAICINQSDYEEKCTQILRMSSIYHDCSRVIMWLGPEDQHTSPAFSTLAHAGAQVEKTVNNMLMTSPDAVELDWWDTRTPVHFSDDMWLHITELGKRPWFYRVWTIQEALLANRFSMMQSGHVTIPWPLFRRATACLTNKDYIPGSRSAIDQLARTGASPIGASLDFTLMKYRMRKCSDPHDKIYGLLAILPDKLVETIKPDYMQPVAELYKSVFLSNIDIIRRWEVRGCPRDPLENSCPSWVPDLSQPDTFGRRPVNTFASGYSSLHYEYQATNLLKVAGVQFDTVRWVTGSSQTDWDDGWAALRCIRYWEPLGDLTDPYPHGGTLLDAFAVTLVQENRLERIPDRGFTLEAIKTRFETEFLSTASEPITRLRDHDSMESILWANSVDRVMLTTEKGSFGLSGCTFAKPGDVICVFLGCDFPVLLRPGEDNTWKYLSDCYFWDLESSGGLLGPLPTPWQAQLLFDPAYGHRIHNYYHNTETGEVTPEDPRLGPLEGWQRVSLEELGRDLTGDDPDACDFFRNTEDGRIVNSDPRLEPEALMRLGVNVETFVLT